MFKESPGSKQSEVTATRLHARTNSLTELEGSVSVAHLCEYCQGPPHPSTTTPHQQYSRLYCFQNLFSSKESASAERSAFAPQWWKDRGFTVAEDAREGDWHIAGKGGCVVVGLSVQADTSPVAAEHQSSKCRWLSLALQSGLQGGRRNTISPIKSQQALFDPSAWLLTLIVEGLRSPRSGSVNNLASS